MVGRRVISGEGSVRKEEKVLTINVKPGWKSGTKITFQREGDQAPNKIPADIIFIIRDKPHPLFRREGSDLKYTCKITLKEVGQKREGKNLKISSGSAARCENEISFFNYVDSGLRRETTFVGV